ncbi:HD-GYP domain-containing protein [Saccharibacillus sp. CPCC 101409]|uniref:HD-GYP domain-containing protein n=1 Tax=Saccharibacillus sp. CPCC 101409 TaxID=3058041 RepID=UPI00267119FA|nr:HD-GYP domain-containing protein [Saccharibacillus sp. CPCC 101409]MDO3413213.1 HD-GYP domain-containing protein [Saccharibacillus sp. CPCC 101409]
MISVPVNELQAGRKIAADVHTDRGNLLFQKGRVLLPRDLEVLRAFLIDHVELQEGQASEPGTPESAENAPNSESRAIESMRKTFKERSFAQEYEQMVALIKNGFPSVLAMEIPIFQWRAQLEKTIEQIQGYRILGFTPKMPDKHDYVYHHAVLCALTSYMLARWMNIPQKNWIQVALAGLLHDIGKVRISPEILHKPEPLAPDEKAEMNNHTTYGYQILKNATALQEGVLLAALQHHERIDGSGYPFKLTGEKQHVYSKIVAVADIFHAMTLDRRYQGATSPYLVLEQLEQDSFGKLDPAIVRTLIQHTTQLSLGTRVKLSNRKVGEIVYADAHQPTRPIVSINGEIVNLIQERRLFILEVL